VSEWQPIATLPHDGDEADREKCGHWHGPVLLYVPDQYGGVMVVAQMDSDMWLYGPCPDGDTRTYGDLGAEPTHWMPLPPPPNGTTT
jgi:hypothetical protein